MHVKHFSTFLRIESAELMKDISAKQNEMEQNGKKKKKPHISNTNSFQQKGNCRAEPFFLQMENTLFFEDKKVFPNST